MFEHDFEEKRESKVDIPDVLSDVFSEFLKYIYTAKIPALSRFAPELLELADKVCKKSFLI